MSTSTPVYPNDINDGDTAWMITATALVYLMTPGVGFFYGGMVDNKNVINQLFLALCCMGLITVQWVLFGYSLAFQPRAAGLGGGNWVTLGTGLTGFMGKDIDPYYSPTYPQLVHALYQGAFAVITPALISGGVVGRIKFWSYMLFLLIWSTVVYDVLAHWMWSADGWLGFNPNGGLGAIDFAGGTVVHISSGVSALTAAWVLGKRLGFDTQQTKPASVPFVMLGAAMLWIGWNGFNAGSAGAANGLAAVALVATNAAAASAAMTWVFLEAGIKGKPTLIGGCIGAVVGLVVITPAAGYVQPGWAVLMGIIGSLVVYGVLQAKHFLRADDTLDVFICHGVGGMVGAFCTGLFAQTDVNPAGPNGAFYGNPIQLGYQVAAVMMTIAYAAGCTAAILYALHFTVGIRCAEEHEIMGLDEAMHGEAYFTLTIEDITKDGSQPLSLKIRRADADADGKAMENYETEANSPSNDDMEKQKEKEKASANHPPIAQAGEMDIHPPPSVSRHASGSRAGSRSGRVPVTSDNLSHAVAQLVSQLALPGHNYDIGISRSC